MQGTNPSDGRPVRKADLLEALYECMETRLEASHVHFAGLQKSEANYIALCLPLLR